MPDCFISYSSVDEELACFVEAHLRTQGLDVFLASVSLQPGQRWSEVGWASLRTSQWVVFLASRAACQSAYEQQELGAVLSLIDFGFALRYGYLGISLKRFLATLPRLIVNLLIAGACYLAIVCVLKLAIGLYDAALKLALTLLITWYLIRNVRRLRVKYHRSRLRDSGSES